LQLAIAEAEKPFHVDGIIIQRLFDPSTFLDLMMMKICSAPFTYAMDKNNGALQKLIKELS